MFGYQNFGDSPIRIVLFGVVHFVPVYKDDQVFILFQSPGFSQVGKHGSLVAALLQHPIQLAQGDDRQIEETVSRERLWEAQTPQVFSRQLLIDAYAKHGDQPSTDDAQVVERSGHRVAIVQGSPVNLKINTTEDLRLAAQALKALPKPKILGPAHPFADDDMWR